MKHAIEVFKATVLGGVVFLIPLAVVLVVLAKIVGMMRAAARPFSAVVPVDSVGGVLLVNVLGVLVILFTCFVAGLVASRGLGKHAVSNLDATLMDVLPGYAFMKGFAESMAKSDALAESFSPVLVRFDDYTQAAFEVERSDEHGYVAIYLPGAPNPWSGSVVYVTPDRVRRLEISVAEAVKRIRTLGRGSEELQTQLDAPATAGS